MTTPRLMGLPRWRGSAWLTSFAALWAWAAVGCSSGQGADVPPAGVCSMPAHAFMLDSNDDPGFRRATLYWNPSSQSCALRAGAADQVPMKADDGAGRKPLAEGVGGMQDGSPVAAFAIDDAGYSFFSVAPWAYDTPPGGASSSNALPEDLKLSVVLHTPGHALRIIFHYSGELAFVDALGPDGQGGPP